ncbi:hypothetical protein MJO28_010192, partial [Puccinia striiformis f. sp. tritici]
MLPPPLNNSVLRCVVHWFLYQHEQPGPRMYVRRVAFQEDPRWEPWNDDRMPSIRYLEQLQVGHSWLCNQLREVLQQDPLIQKGDAFWQPLILFILFSYWIPQIDHNVQHGTSRRGLRKRYVLGTTLCRLFLPLYIWGCPNNVLFVTVN